MRGLRLSHFSFVGRYEGIVTGCHMAPPKDTCHIPHMTHEHTSTESAKTVLYPLAGLVALVAILGVAIATFGIAGLIVPYIALVPITFVVLVWIAMGKT